MQLIVMCAAALAGIALADVHAFGAAPLLALAILSLVAAACGRCVWRSLALVALAFSMGAVRAVMLPPIAPPATGVLGALRASARQNITANLPEPQASLAAGVLLGGSGRLDAGFRDDLQRSGLAHVLAIDGFKQVVLAGGIGWLSSRVLGARAAGSITLASVVGYTLLTGAHASAVRAALMLSLGSLGALSGRVADPLLGVALASLIMAALDPAILLDLGMQLSLSATLGLILLWPGLRRTSPMRALPRWVGEPLGLSAAVTLACLPITLATFEQVSLVSPLAHVMAVPLLPGVLVGAACLSVLAALPPPLPAFGAWLAWAPTSLLTGVIRLFGEMPGAAITTGHLPLVGSVALATGLLACGVWQLPELADARYALSIWLLRRGSLAVALAASATCVLVAFCLHVVRPDGQTHVWPLSVANGRAVFIRGPTGRTTLLVQGRPDGGALSSAVAEHLAVWEHKLDEVALIDAPAERAAALTLKRYPADVVVRGAPGETTSALTTSAARQGSAD